MKKILGNLGIYSVILIALSGSVYAVGRTVSNKSATIDVTATVQPSCTIFANDLLFQITNFSKKNSYTGRTTLSLLCTKGTSFSIGLDKGSSPAATITNRKMKNRASYLNYSLYRDVGNSLLWGNSQGSTLAGIATGERQTFTVYAKIPSGQKSEPGKYLDNINVVVNLGSGANKLSYQLSVAMNVILKNTETPGYNNR
jgi:spore coat protein U-like protein